MISDENTNGTEPGLLSWRASYREIPARSRYMQGKSREFGGERSDIENRMPLLGNFRHMSPSDYPQMRKGGKGILPSHVYETKETTAIGAKLCEFGLEVVNRDNLILRKSHSKRRKV